MDYLPLPGTPVEDLDTPAIIVDLDIAESNIKAMADFAKENGVSMRPHMKTGKSPFWARKMMDAGAIGVCAAKVGEAEILADGGIREILIPNQVVGSTKIRRLFGVSARSNVTVAVDSHENVAELSEAAQAFDIELGVILEVETGMNRAGVEPLGRLLPHWPKRSTAHRAYDSTESWVTKAAPFGPKGLKSAKPTRCKQSTGF